MVCVGNIFNELLIPYWLSSVLLYHNSNIQSGLLKAIELGSTTTLEDLQELQKNCYGAKIAFCSVHHQSPIALQCGGDVSIIFFNAIVGFVIGSSKIGVFRTTWETIHWINLPN